MSMSNYNAKRRNDYLKKNKMNKGKPFHALKIKKFKSSKTGRIHYPRIILIDRGTEGTPPKQGE